MPSELTFFAESKDIANKSKWLAKGFSKFVERFVPTVVGHLEHIPCRRTGMPESKLRLVALFLESDGKQ